MARTDPTIYMRLPQELKDALDAAAAENKRSLTAEVVARLELSFKVYAEADSHMARTSNAEVNADAIADKVADRLAERMLVPPMSEEMSRFIRELYLDSNQKHSEAFKEQFGFDPRAPQVQQHGGAPVKSRNAKLPFKKKQ